MLPITKKQALTLGMSPLTHPELPESPFFKAACLDMQKVSGTKWAIVHAEKGKQTIWRKRIPVPKNYESGTIRN